MKKNEFIMLIIGVFFSLTINAQLQISYTPQDIVCPNFGTNYSYTSSLQTYSVTWTLSGGSFSATNPNVTSSTNSAVTVYWSNAVSTNNQAPKGTLKLTANYTNGTQGEVSISQNIKSLNGATPPALRSTSSTNLNMGNNTFRVYMNNTFYFPGIKQGGVAVPVILYEWTLPQGWKDSNGKTGTFIVGTPYLDIITDNFSAGEVKVRGKNDCSLVSDYSNVSKITFTRNFAFNLYPSSITYGIKKSYNFAVTSLSGVVYEWKAPSGWIINGVGNVLEAANLYSVTVVPGNCISNGVVSVRLKKDNQVSAWYNCPYQGIVPPVIQNSAISQFKKYRLTLDVTTNEVQSVSWVGDGVLVTSGQGTVSPEVIFSKTGSINLQAQLVMNGCTDVYPVTKVVNVSSSDLIISGPDVVCNSATYIMNNLPSEVSIEWEFPDNKFSLVSGQNTNTIDVTKNYVNSSYGNGTIRAKLSLNGNIAYIYKTALVGSPYISSVSGPSSARVNQNVYFTADPIYDASICNYQWIVSPSYGVSQSPYRHTNSISFSQTGTYSVSCRTTTNECGAAGSAAYLIVSVGEYYMLSPNPTSGIINIISSELDVVNSLANVQNNNDGIDYEVYSSSSNILIQTGKIKKHQKTLDLHNLNNGNYIIRIKTLTNKYESHKIIIKK